MSYALSNSALFRAVGYRDAHMTCSDSASANAAFSDESVIPTCLLRSAMQWVFQFARSSNRAMAFILSSMDSPASRANTGGKAGCNLKLSGPPDLADTGLAGGGSSSPRRTASWSHSNALLGDLG